MTTFTIETAIQLRRFAWLCDELAAGNEFSPETLRRWGEQARRELERRGKGAKTLAPGGEH